MGVQEYSMKKLSFIFLAITAFLFCMKVSGDERSPEMYLHVQKLYSQGHTYMRIINTWNANGDITLHDPHCVCGQGELKMKLDSLEYDMNVPIPHH